MIQPEKICLECLISRHWMTQLMRERIFDFLMILQHTENVLLNGNGIIYRTTMVFLVYYK